LIIDIKTLAGVTLVYGFIAAAVLFLAPLSFSAYARRGDATGTARGKGKSWRRTGRPSCDLYWAAGTMVTTIAMGLLFLQGSASPWIGIVLANVLFYAGMLLVFFGLEYFRGASPSLSLAIIASCSVVFLIILFTFAFPSVKARIVVFSSFISALYAACAVSSLRSRADVKGPIPFIAFCDFFVLASFFLVRAVFNLSSGTGSIFSQGIMNALTFILPGFAVIIWALALTLLRSASFLRDKSRGEELYRGIFESADVGIFQSSLTEGTFILVNRTFARMFGFEDFGALKAERGESTAWIYGEKGSRHDLVDGLEGTGHYESSPLLTTRRDGSPIWCLINATLVQRDEGRNIVTGTVIDVTDRVLEDEAMKRAHDEKAFLLKELQHRIKNGMTVIASLIGLEASRTQDEAALSAFRALGAKVRALATLYDLLYRSQDPVSLGLSLYLRSVVEALGASYGAAEKGIAISFDVDRMLSTSKKAEALGLMAVELITDAFKHGFPGGRRGHIGFSLKRTAEGAVMEVADDGVGLPPGFSVADSRGFGMGIVEVLASQVDGRFEILPGPGARFRVSFPL
jgi:PAS domain S-box-containing protein